MTDLYKWVEDQNYFKRSNEVPIPSHLLYDKYNGGKMYIPRNKEYEFLVRYAKEFEKGTDLYIVETRPKTFKFMVDVDMTDTHYWINQEIIELVKIIQTVVFDFFGNNQVTIICT